MIRLLVLLGTLFLYQGAACGESIYPETGKPCPDFALKKIKYFYKKAATLSDFHGKWLVLDFWNKGCAACIAGFPRENSVQKELGNQVQVMLVGIQDEEKQIQPMFARFRENQHLEIPCAFDSALANRWDIYTAPYIIVIDPSGIVQAITYSVNTDDMRAFINGTAPRLPKVYRVHEEEKDMLFHYNASRPFLIESNGGRDTAYLFRSVLSAFDMYQQPTSAPATIFDDTSRGIFQVLGVPLFMLYNYAYYGKPVPDSGYALNPVLEIRDSGFFQASIKYNRNLFCYSLSIPVSQFSKERMQQMMQHDLGNYFSYTVTVEERQFPCLRLVVVSDKAKQRLQTRGGKESLQTILPKAEFIASNWLLSKFMDLISVFNDHEIIDGTGIKGNIDIHMKCLLTDITEVTKELQAHGLDLAPAEITKKVLVIRDAPFRIP